MFGHADAVAIGDFGHGDAVLDRGLQIGMVRADAGGDDQLQLGRLGDAFRRHVGRPEGLRNDDLGVGQFLVELSVGAVLVGGDDQLVAGRLQKFPQAQLAGDAAQQFAGLEVDGLGRGQGLAVGIRSSFGRPSRAYDLG